KVEPGCKTSLKGKKVVVITKAQGTRADFLSLDRELNKEVVKILRENIKRIDIVNPDDVYRWDSAHPVSDPGQMGEAFDAEIVIPLTIRGFQIEDPSSPEMYEGKSDVHIEAYELSHPKDARGREMLDKPRESNMVHEDDRSTIFPVRGPIPASADVTRAEFKN